MRTRLLIVVAFAASTAVVVADPASAASRSGREGSGGAYVSPEGDPTATARDGAGVGASSGASGPVDDPCDWVVIVEDDSKFFIYDFQDPSKVLHSATGRWLEYRCNGRGSVEVGGSPLAPEGGLVDPRQLALDAVSSVRIDAPVIRTSPAETGRLYVRVPTWLWVETEWWQGYEATASTGRVTSTVRAVPVSVSWNPGDGNTVTCSGPGIAWRPGTAEDATACSHTYTSSSVGRPGGRFDLSATVTLDVSWTSNVDESGTLDPISRSASRSVEVGEIQAVGTR
jgi:hypothetical protein